MVLKEKLSLKALQKFQKIFFLSMKFLHRVLKKPIKLKLIRKLKQIFVCKIENVETRTDAENFKGLKLFISRKSLPKLSDKEFYHSDLLNFEFII